MCVCSSFRASLPSERAAARAQTALTAPPALAHLQLPVTMKDGTTAFLDLERNAHLAPYRIPNVWAQQEDRLRRSGMEVPSRGRPCVPPSLPFSSPPDAHLV